MIKCVYTNAQCLTNKLAELNDICSKFSPDLIAVTETWFQSHMADVEFSIPNMTLLRRDRSRKGGGVALYYNQRFQCTELQDASLNIQDALWCSLTLNSGDDCIVGVVYRSPSATDTHNDQLLEVLHHVTSQYRTQLLIMGDFNLPQLYTNTDHSPHTLVHKFRELFDLTPLYNHVSQYTRMRGLEQQSMLDLVLTSEDTSIETIDYNEPLGRSDHLVLTFDYICSTKRLINKPILTRKVNYSALMESLQAPNNQSIDYDNPDTHWTSLLCSLNSKIDENSRLVPKKAAKDFRFTIRSRTKKWITLRSKAWAVHKVTNTPASWTQFRKVRNKVIYLIREDKELFQLHLIWKMEQNPKMLYQILNARTKLKPGVSPLQTPSGLTASAQDTADALANFYAQVFTPKVVLPAPRLTNSTVTEELCDIVITPGLVRQHLLSLNTRKSPGEDQITPAILKTCHSYISVPIADLFNHSLSVGRVPARWKIGVISPIYKGGRRSDVANYRPVTLLPVVSKVMERIVAERIQNHLESQNLLSAAQHGFRKHRSCLTNLLTTLDDWTSTLDSGDCIHSCFLDISKAFDRVNHDLLLKKLRAHGVTGNLLAWLKDYLADRYTKVRVGGTLSRTIEVTSGVPQGSVLGPILFLIFVNDLPQLVGCKIVLFADDIKIWKRIKSTEDCLLLQKDLDTLNDWSAENKLPFNFQKTQMLALGKTFEHTYRLGTQDLKWTSSGKDLGVLVCGSLKSSSHCQVIFKRASQTLGMLKRILGRFSPTVFPAILNTYLRPSMEYALPAWAPWLQKDVSMLDKIYHRATKLVRGLQHLTYSERMQRLDLLDFTKRRIRCDLILTYNILNANDHPLEHLFHPASERITRRHSHAVTIPHSRLNCRRFFYSVRVCFVWNMLPKEIVNAPCVATFKKMLNNYMHTDMLHVPVY